MEIGTRIEWLLCEEYLKQLPALREIADPPKALWLRGSLPAEGTKLLAVVGSRALTRYGREATELLIGGLAGYPISIVSGLALGADAAAHKAALDAGLHTIAIPGGGVDDDSIGPRSNLGLAHKILESGGAILSEHEPGYLAHPFDFPTRNRIMVGLADAVLIIEAGPKSGTLITARLAGEYNRHLLCVPHRIGDPHGYGAHIFLRLGATLITDSLHILDALQIEPRKEDESISIERLKNLTQSEQRVYEALEIPQSRDELIRAINLPITQALTILISLEFKGVVREEFGAWRRV
jgi:DNA processing protein